LWIEVAILRLPLIDGGLEDPEILPILSKGVFLDNDN
jgi:hypothetical protein